VEDRKPVTAMSNRELLEEADVILRRVSDMLAEFEPLLAMVRGMNGNGPSYVQAAGLRRGLKRGRADASKASSTAPRRSPGPAVDPAPG
jgi:hypothetical protein